MTRKRKPWHRKRGWADKWAKKYNMRKTKGGVWVKASMIRKRRKNCGCRRNPVALRLKDAKAQLRARGMVLTKKAEYGEYRVNYKGGREDSAYYTTDLKDAVGTGLLMANNPKWKFPFAAPFSLRTKSGI